MASQRLQVIHLHLTNSSLKFNRTNATSTAKESNPAKFRYTLDNPLLTYEQRRFYEENGYLIVPKLIENELLDECSRRFVDYCNGVLPKEGFTMVKDVSLAKKGAKGEYLINKIQDILFDDVFEKYFFHPKLVDYVSCFTGPNITLMHSMLINKPPDSGALTSRHPLHQDLLFSPIRPADLTVTCWTSIDLPTLDNGCLEVLPGTHKGELLRHDYPKWEGGVNKGYHGVIGYDNHKTVPLIMEKGDTVFFHPLLIHGSGANKTNTFRKAISGHYCTSKYYVIDAQGTLQENLFKEAEEVLLKKGLPITFQEYWQYKSRVIRGEDFFK